MVNKNKISGRSRQSQNISYTILAAQTPVEYAEKGKQEYDKYRSEIIPLEMSLMHI